MNNETILILSLVCFMIIYSCYYIGSEIDHQKQLDLQYQNDCFLLEFELNGAVNFNYNIPINDTKNVFCFNYTSDLRTTR